MHYPEAKKKFINTWGVLGSNWGINRTMAQMHAMLLVSTEPVSTDDIMAELSISRGNANMNIRTLIDWGLVYREHIPGERMEYFVAEKDMYKVAKLIIKLRKEKEINPILNALSQLQHVEGNDKQSKEFVKMMKDINDLTGKASNLADKMLAADETWLGKTLLKLMR